MNLFCLLVCSAVQNENYTPGLYYTPVLYTGVNYTPTQTSKLKKVVQLNWYQSTGGSFAKDKSRGVLKLSIIASQWE